MKSIQITLDEGLLARLDADAEVQRDGRSAVIRRATDEYLRRRRAVAEQYATAYIGGQATDDDLRGWEDEGAWPKP